jgi:hypothetical protein
VTVNEGVIRDALLQSTLEDLEDVLTTIEAYRLCTFAARKLRRFRTLHRQRRQLLECAQVCESALAGLTATGSLGQLRYPEAGADAPDLIFFQKW